MGAWQTWRESRHARCACSPCIQTGGSASVALTPVARIARVRVVDGGAVVTTNPRYSTPQNTVQLIMVMQSLRSMPLDMAPLVVPCTRCKALSGALCVSKNGHPITMGRRLGGEQRLAHTVRMDSAIRIRNGMCPEAWIDDMVAYGVSPAAVFAEATRSPGFRLALRHGMVERYGSHDWRVGAVVRRAEDAYFLLAASAPPVLPST